MPTPFRVLLLALVAFAAVLAPGAATANGGPITDSLDLQLEIFDLSASTACGLDVFANLEGTIDRRLYLDKDGKPAYQIEAFHGRIEWFTRGTGKSYSSSIVNRTRIDFVGGTDEFFTPVVVTTNGEHGGVFPIGGGPAGHGTLVYDGFWYGQDDAGFVYWATDGPPVSMSGNFETTNRRICKALS
jgi:hypothetical protein